MKHQPHPQPSEHWKPKYPYFYSASIVDSFIDSYSRATYFLAKKLGYDPKDFRMTLIKLFMSGSPRWNITREVIKKVENWNMYNELMTYDRSGVLKYLTSVRTMVEDELIDKEILHKRY